MTVSEKVKAFQSEQRLQDVVVACVLRVNQDTLNRLKRGVFDTTSGILVEIDKKMSRYLSEKQRKGDAA